MSQQQRSPKATKEETDTLSKTRQAPDEANIARLGMEEDGNDVDDIQIANTDLEPPQDC